MAAGLRTQPWLRWSSRLGASSVLCVAASAQEWLHREKARRHGLALGGS